MADIKDVLQDLVSFSVPLGLEKIKVTTDEKSTVFESSRDDTLIIMKAETKFPIDKFHGSFGMGNLKILKGYIETFTKIANGTESEKDLKIEIKRNNKDGDVPTDIEFHLPKSATAVYRLMNKDLPKQLRPAVNFNWDTEIEQPAKSKIQELSSFASILSDVEKKFMVKSDGEKLKLYIGAEDSSTSKVNMVFSTGIKSKVNPAVAWHCNDFLSIMNLAANASTIVKISNMGVIQVIVDTGLIRYEFLLPGTKP